MNKHMLQWQKIRKKGMKRYILVKGIIAFGILVPLIFEVFRFLFEKAYLIKKSPISLYVLDFLARSAVFIIIGFLFSLLSWYSNERKFKN